MVEAKSCGTGRSASQAINQNSQQPWFKQGYIMVKAPEVTQPLKDVHSQSSFIKQLDLPKEHGTSLINVLTTNPQVIEFFKGRPIDYSQLTPHIELRKVYIHGKEDIEEFPFPFKTFQDFTNDWPAAVSGNRLFRGRDAGIQTINVKMEGRQRNPVSANIMDVTIKFFFNDVQTLFQRIGQLEKSGHSVSFSDLIRYPPSLRKSARSYRIRLIMGWSINKDNPYMSDQPYGKEFIAAVENSKMSIAADLYTHNMEFNQDGSLVITAKYKGALESAFSSQSSNILNNVAPKSDPSLLKINSKIAEEEQKYQTMGLSEGAGSEFEQIQAIEKATEALNKIREAMAKSMNSDGAYPETTDIAEAYSKLDELNTNYNKIYPNGRKPLQQLQSAAKGTEINKLVKKSVIEDKNAQKLEDNKARILSSKKKPSRKARTAHKKALKLLRQQKQEFIKAIQGKHLFSYVEYLRQNNKIAWLSTGRKTKFGDYKALMDVIEKKAGTEKGAAEIEKHVDKLIEKPASKHSYQLALDNNSNWKDDLNLGVDLDLKMDLPSLSPTDYDIDIPFEPLTPSEKGSAKIANSDAGGLKLDKGKTKTENGDANLWEVVKTTRYKKGEKIYFFRLGDLLTAILQKGNFGETLAEEAPNFRLLLGQYDIPHMVDGTVIRNSIYDLPISLEIFHIFVAQKIVGTGRSQYPLLQFTFDLIKFVMDKTQNAFGKAAEFTPTQLVPIHFKLDMTSVDLPIPVLNTIEGSENRDIIKLKDNNQGLNPLNITSIKNTSNCFVLHAKRKLKHGENSIYNGDIKEDEGRGIFHFFVGGPDRGILKKIDFTQAGNSLFATALMRNGQDDGKESSREGIIKPSKFSCELTLVGNPFFYIGQMFYVNTDLISGGHFADPKNAILNGGYYVVTGVENNFNVSRWETKIRGVLNIPDHALRSFKDRKQLALTKVNEKPREERIALRSKAEGPNKKLGQAVSSKTPDSDIGRVA